MIYGVNSDLGCKHTNLVKFRLSDEINVVIKELMIKEHIGGA